MVFSNCIGRGLVPMIILKLKRFFFNLEGLAIFKLKFLKGRKSRRKQNRISKVFDKTFKFWTQLHPIFAGLCFYILILFDNYVNSVEMEILKKGYCNTLYFNKLRQHFTLGTIFSLWSFKSSVEMHVSLLFLQIC